MRLRDAKDKITGAQHESAMAEGKAGKASRQCTCTGVSTAGMRLHRALCSTGASRLVMLQNFLEGFQDSARQSLRCLT